MIKWFLKNIPSFKIKYVVWTIVILFILLILSVKRDKEGMIKIGNTILVMKNFNKTVDLAVEERLNYEAEIQKINDQIANFVPGTGKEMDLGNGMIGIIDNSNPNLQRFLTKAQNLSLIGQNNKAIRTLYKAFRYYPASSNIIDMLAAVYADAGHYQYALNQYNQIIDKNPDLQREYYPKIIQMYINFQDAETAGQMYIDYVKMGGEKDLSLMNQIRKLKGLGELKGFNQPTFQ